MSATPQSERQELVQREIDIWNEGTLDDVDEVYAEGAKYTDPMGTVHDRESLKEYIDMIRTAFPDFHVDVRAFAETGDSVACRYTFHGTMEGTYRGFEPTGESFELHGISWTRIEDGKVVETWNTTNSMSMARQLGLLE